MKAFRAVCVAAAVLLAVAALALWQGPGLLQWDRYRATIERIASAGLGRPVRIGGPIRLSLLPAAVLRAAEVEVADTGDGAGATVAELRMRVGLRALLFGRLEPQDLVLGGARMHLPWPLARFALRDTPLPGGFHARVEGGTLLLGGLQISGVAGELSAGGPDTALSASGLATVFGRPWRMTARLGHPGSDGSATLEVSLDGQGAGIGIGTGAAFTGQVASGGSLSGRFTGRGPDLSRLLPAPAQAWTADGRLLAGSGLLVADDLDLTIGGTPARGAVALRLLPQLRLDAALATNRLDLDAWLPPLLGGGPVALPTGIDLSAEAAPLAGGTLRRLRAGFELAGGGVTLRDADALLPGDAALHLSGVLSGRDFAGAATLAAPDLGQTLAWLRPHAPALVDALPAGALRTANLSATVQANPDDVALAGLGGAVDGVLVSGTLGVHRGARPALAMALHLAGPVLDRWLPPPPEGQGALLARLGAAAHWADGFDADVEVSADHPVWRGAAFDRFAVEGTARAGTLDLRRAALAGSALSVTASGRLDPGLRVTDGRLLVVLPDAGLLGRSLPPAWQSVRPALYGAAAVDAAVAGPSGAWVTTVQAEMADARLRLEGKWDLPGRRWSGTAFLHHPGAPRLLSSFGLSGLVDWLGDGSLSVRARLDSGERRLAASRLDVSAGGVRGTGELALAWPVGARPMLTGQMDFDALPVPLVPPRSTTPLPLDGLRALDAAVAVHAGQVSWGGGAPGGPASARVDLAGGVLHLGDLRARLGGGTLTGQVTIDAAALPQVAATLSLTGAAIDGPLFGTALDLTAGTAGATADVTATGYSPAALLGSLAGAIRVSARDGMVAGFSAGDLLSVLHGVPASAAGPPDLAAVEADATRALGGGGTPFQQLTAAGTLAGGLFTLKEAAAATPAATVAATGTLDLPAAAMDLTLTLQPKLDGAPPVGLRLIGPYDAVGRVPGFAPLVGWLATR